MAQFMEFEISVQVKIVRIHSVCPRASMLTCVSCTCLALSLKYLLKFKLACLLWWTTPMTVKGGHLELIAAKESMKVFLLELNYG